MNMYIYRERDMYYRIAKKSITSFEKLMVSKRAKYSLRKYDSFVPTFEESSFLRRKNNCFVHTFAKYDFSLTNNYLFRKMIYSFHLRYCLKGSF